MPRARVLCIFFSFIPTDVILVVFVTFHWIRSTRMPSGIASDHLRYLNVVCERVFIGQILKNNALGFCFAVVCRVSSLWRSNSRAISELLILIMDWRRVINLSVNPSFFFLVVVLSRRVFLHCPHLDSWIRMLALWVNRFSDLIRLVLASSCLPISFTSRLMIYWFKLAMTAVLLKQILITDSNCLGVDLLPSLLVTVPLASFLVSRPIPACARMVVRLLITLVVSCISLILKLLTHMFNSLFYNNLKIILS